MALLLSKYLPPMGRSQEGYQYGHSPEGCKRCRQSVRAAIVPAVGATGKFKILNRLKLSSARACPFEIQDPRSGEEKKCSVPAGMEMIGTRKVHVQVQCVFELAYSYSSILPFGCRSKVVISKLTRASLPFSTATTYSTGRRITGVKLKRGQPVLNLPLPVSPFHSRVPFLKLIIIVENSCHSRFPQILFLRYSK